MCQISDEGGTSIGGGSNHQEYSKVIFKIRHTRNRGGPEVTVDEVKVAGSVRMRGRKREAHITTQLARMAQINTKSIFITNNAWRAS